MYGHFVRKPYRAHDASLEPSLYFAGWFLQYSEYDFHVLQKSPTLIKHSIYNTYQNCQIPSQIEIFHGTDSFMESGVYVISLILCLLVVVLTNVNYFAPYIAFPMKYQYQKKDVADSSEQDQSTVKNNSVVTHFQNLSIEYTHLSYWLLRKWPFVMFVILAMWINKMP